jgi:AcrR family transcriptional regulator
VSGTTNAVRNTRTQADDPEASPAGPSRRDARRAAARREIVDAAWAMVREDGLAGLSMRTLGERVGMRAQSLYSYFGSKDDIYDALFRDGNEQFLAWMTPAMAAADDGDPVAVARNAVRRYFEFCVADPVRYELLFQRNIPGFTPSAESYSVALEALGRAAEALIGLGITDPEALDLWTAVTTGLTSQQLANDPGGDRWERLIDRAVHMLLAELAPQLLEPSRTATPTATATATSTATTTSTATPTSTRRPAAPRRKTR